MSQGKTHHIKNLTEHHWSNSYLNKKIITSLKHTFFPTVSNMHRCSWLDHLIFRQKAQRFHLVLNTNHS